jgi:hypothetical protein
MNDLIVLLLTAAFFVIAVAYVGLCDRIIGPDPEPENGDAADATDVEVEVVSA